MEISIPQNIRKYYRFCSGLRAFLQNTLSLEQAEEIVRKRMEDREENFLKVVEKGIYGYKRSPYLKLLEIANYRYSDIKKLVEDEGLNGALDILRENGVYISYEESKGKRPIVRNGRTIEAKESDFHNPHLAHYYEARSGATRSPGTRTRIDFEFLEQGAAYDAVLFDIYDIQDAPIGVWLPTLPAGAGTSGMLKRAKIGKTPTKWFTPLDRRSINPSITHLLTTNYIIYVGRILGKKFPKPEFVDLNNSVEIARWIDSMLKETGKCCFSAYASLAVRICKEAKNNGVELDGAMFIVGGEPITVAKQKEIESVGAIVKPIYVMTEAGLIGGGCNKPVETDEVHFFKDSLALIQRKRMVKHSEIEVNSLLLTSLLPAAPRILLNMETDDYGIVVSRNCGCQLQDLGFSEHIHNIRSFSKLTGEGMTFVGTDLIKIIEEDLPRLYGGSPLDYQLLEKEDSSGFTRVFILVSPEVGKINEEELKKTFLELLSENRAKNLMAKMWAKGNTIVVKRDYPIPTKSGKIMPLHIIS